MTPETKEKLEAAGLVGAAVLAVLKIKPVETLLDEWVKRWLANRPKRQLARRMTEAEQALLLSYERQELDTVCIMLKDEYRADRVTVAEYHCPATGPKLATITAEERTARVSAVRTLWQQTPIPDEMWAEIQRVHALAGRYWFVPDTSLIEVPSVRKAMVSSGVKSVYFHSLPTRPGDCGGMLTVSWYGEPGPDGKPLGKQLSPDELAGLQLSARMLATVLRSIWPYEPTAS